MAEPAQPTDHIKRTQKLAYGVGHVLNDLAAAVWFSYLLVFFHKILQFSNQLSGYVMLLGQVADAVCTPFIGYESDRTTGFGKYGQRKSWHLVGCICVMLSFPFIFTRCPGCETADDWAQFIYYAPLIVIFQFGWAATQISHLSFIPELTPHENERVGLNAIRYAATVLSSLFVYSMAWVYLGMGDSNLNSSHDFAFRNLALTVVGTGFVFVVTFHAVLKEKPKHRRGNRDVGAGPINSTEEEDGDEQTSMRAHVGVRDWLKEPQFYQVALLYMATRLTVNLSQVYMPMYLTDTLSLPTTWIAIIPLLVYVAGLLSAVVMKKTNHFVGRKVTYVIGGVMVVGAGAGFYFLKRGAPTWQIIVTAAVLGFGNSSMLITSLAIVADLIGNNTSSGAFVYGCMSFVDKLSNGVAVVLIQNFQPCPDVEVCCLDCVWYYQYMMAFVPSATAILGIVGVLSLACTTIGDLRLLRGSSLENKTPYRAGSGTSTAETERLLASELSHTEPRGCWCCCCLPAPASPPLSHQATSQPRRYGSLGNNLVHRLADQAAINGDDRNESVADADYYPRTPPPSLAAAGDGGYMGAGATQVSVQSQSPRVAGVVEAHVEVHA